MTMSGDVQVKDRRPIRSRDSRWAHASAAALARWGMTPNSISILGMIAACLAGVCFACTRLELPSHWLTRGLWLAGAVLVQLRLIANLLDGMVAIEQQKRSAVGALYNEVPDRVSDAGAFIGLGYAFGGVPVLGFLAALLAVFVAYVRAQNVAAGAPQNFGGIMAKPQRMAIVTVGAVLCAALPSAWQTIIVAGHDLGLASLVLAIITLGCVVTAWQRLTWAARALRENSHV
jgi:phosphatidylglycerophosphate synthase